ncbi:MAG: hypothetical protein K8L97_20720 [Anaerolineae bacterium]|nr:hypothetical protein [Anaerolineae bacterium]
MSNAFQTLNQFFGTDWPDYLPDWPDKTPFDHIFIEPPPEGETEVRTRLRFDQELVTNLPDIDAVSFVLAPGGGVLVDVEADKAGTFELRIIDVPMVLRFSPILLRPVRPVSGQPGVFEPDPTVTQVEASLGNVTVKIDSAGGIDLETSGSVTLPPMMIGESGVVIDASGILAHLKNATIPAEYASLGLPNGWQGLLIERAPVTLPPDLAVDFGGELAFEHCAIGDGGFSGKLTYTPVPAKEGKLMGIGFALNSVKLDFAQNSLNEASINGTLDLPLFDKPIGVKVGFNDAAEFDIQLDGAATSYKLRLPGISDEDIVINNPDFALHTTGDEKCAVLRWTENDLKRFLGNLSPALKDQSPPAPAEMTLRVIFGDPIAEFRLEWEFQNQARTLALPGIKVTIPQKTRCCVLFGGGGRSFTNLSFTLTLDANTTTQAASTFAWGRGDDRELQNDDEPANDNPLFQLNLKTKNAISLVLMDMDVAEVALPRFLQQLETPLAKLDFDAEETLCDATPFVLQSLNPDTWLDSQFIVNKDAFKMPFLQQKEDNPQDTQFAQFIQIKPPSTNTFQLDFAKSSIAIAVELTLTFGPISFNSDITFKFNWVTFAVEVDHDSGLKLLSKNAELAPSKHLGLTWRLKGAKAENNLYHYFTLVTKDYNYQVQMAEDAVFELDYTQASQEPITFAVSEFVLSPKGIDLTAEVTDRPARMNGIDTRFRFHGSRIEIKENRIKDFTLAGSGPLPPALVGDAMVDIALQFAQREGNLTLVAGSAQLQGNKLLDCKGTRFQFSVDAIGLKFVNDGKFHLYFTLTGSAQFVLAPGDDNEGALALLPKIKIDMVECPLTGDASVIAKHVQFLIELPKPLSFSFLKCFEFELRGFGFLPQAEVFDGDPAMVLSGQIKFAQGTGDALNAQIDFHNLHLGLPAKGTFFPRIYLKRLAVNISMGSAFELYGMVEFTDEQLKQGFEGEGSLTIQGMPRIAASFGFMRVRRDENSPWLRAWFIYLEVQRVSFRIPVIEIYLREIGLGFGYRYTIASIKAADLQNDIKKLLQELKALSKTQGDLSKIDRWAVDLEDRGEDPRWTIVLRAMISQTSGSLSPLQYIESAEMNIACVFLIDAIIAFRSDLTFFMAARAWLNTNYHEFTTGGTDVSEKPLFSGFILLSVRKKLFLMNVSSNQEAFIGNHPPLPDFVKETIKNVQFSATLLIQPGLFHFELGWPNMLRWGVKIGELLKIEYQAGFIFRITPRDLTIGMSLAARGTLDIKAELDLGLVGVRVRAFAEVAFGARLIARSVFLPPDFSIYGAIGLELRIEISIELWIKIPLIFTTIELSFRLSLGIGFTTGMEVGFGLNPADRGIRGTGTLSISAMGHSLHVSVKLAINEGAVEKALAVTKEVMNLGLEATDVEGVPGVEATAIKATRIRGNALPGIIPGKATRVRDLAVGKPAKITATTQAEVIEFHLPNYSMFVIRQPDAGGWSYFILLPKGEKQFEEAGKILDGIEPGFLPPPPLKLILKRIFLTERLDQGRTEEIKEIFGDKNIILNQPVLKVRTVGSEWTIIDRVNPAGQAYLIRKLTNSDRIAISELRPTGSTASFSIFTFPFFDLFSFWIGPMLDAGILLYQIYEAISQLGHSLSPFSWMRPILERNAWLITDGSSGNLFRLQYRGVEGEQMKFELTQVEISTQLFDTPLDIYQIELDRGELPEDIRNTFASLNFPLETSITVSAIAESAKKSWRIHENTGEQNNYRVMLAEDHYEIMLEVEQDFTFKMPEAFSFPSNTELVTELNMGQVSSGLRGTFENEAGIVLSSQSSLSIITADSEWQITDAESTPPLEYRIRKVADKLVVYGGILIEQFVAESGWTTRSNALMNNETLGWRVNWDANAFDAKQYDVATTGNSEQAVNPRNVRLTLADYLNYGYRLKAMPANVQPQVIPIGDPETNLLKDNGSVIEDERVYNPSDNAFEAAVRGAVEQFEGSPYFKRDPNVLYDRLLGEAFQDDTTIYHPSGKVPQETEQRQAMQENQQAMQLRGMAIQDFVSDIREYATLSTNQQAGYPTDSTVFQMGMVFRFKGNTPEWLDGIVGDNEPKPTLSQRLSPDQKTPTTDEATAETFNIFQTDFAKNPPQFQRVQQYTDANTIAITWDLGWSNPPHNRATKAQRDPEHHLVHYLVRRRTLDGRDRETVYTVKNAQALHLPKGSLMQRLKPRFQIVDHFSKETLDDLASLPATGRSYLYSITPVDFAGNLGRPLTLVATRYPNLPPLVPVSSELMVTYRLANDILAPENATMPTTPEIVMPHRIHVEWTEPTDARRGVHVPVAIYRLIFRKDPTMPIGSYGLDSSTQGPRTKSLPTSNARPVPTDIKIELELDSDGPKSARKRSELTLDTLQNAGVISDGVWRPESWQVFFQTESVNGVPSALAPVQLLLRVEKATLDGSTAAEERRPAELEWLANPVQFQLLPPEDQRAEPGLAHFPMPTGNAMVFNGSLTNIEYQEHPAGIRCIRFRWNQGPSNAPDYPLDLNAGYYILQLDIDAQTDETFEDKAKLANALRSIQEVQMLPADDLLLTPGNTLTVNQWEAWYPSALRRRRTKESMTTIRSQIKRGPWYSWRESVLEWPPCPLDLEIDTPQKQEGMIRAKGETFERAKPFHHILQRIVDELSRPGAENETKKAYTVDLQVSPPIQPIDLAKLMETTTPKNDPYGWAVLQRFGLTIGFTLHQPNTGEVVYGDELLSAVQQALETLDANEQLKGYKDYLYVELLFNSGQAVSLKPQSTNTGALLAVCQISLRPRTRQYLKYASLNITGTAGSKIAVTFTLTKSHPCSLLIQSAPRSEQTSGLSGQIELEPIGIKPIKREMKLPLNGDMTLLLRSAELPGVQISIETPIKVGNLSAFKDQLSYDLTNKQIIVKQPLGKLDDEKIAKLRAALEGDDEAFNTLINLNFTAVTPFLPTSEFSTYFTAPNKLLLAAFANPASTNGGQQWATFRRYAEAINGPNTPQIRVPKTVPDIEALLPKYLEWSQRFFDAAGDVAELMDTQNKPLGLMQTAVGPWVATAYPRMGSPAYATPDASGRLKYDHLLEDKWAHNYRYYIRPYGRYDLLWQSFRQSPNLFPNEQVQKLADAVPNPADGGLDVVLDRMQPVDPPLILSSSRLDAAPKPGQPVPPGSMWEVIVAQHPEQALIERNQTLARQLAFRQVAFTLLRRFTYDKWTAQLEDALEKHDLSGTNKYADYVIDTLFIENRTSPLPGSYPEKPDHLDLTALSENDARSLDLPQRIGAFQQGALALQWEALPFYYTHKLLVIAQTASTVSSINQVEQRDFEYRSPQPGGLISSAEETINFNGVNLTTRIRQIEIPLRRFWDSLPETAQTQWSSENPDAPSAENGTQTKKWTFGGLPDPEVVYQIVEVFNGNIEVQAEFYFDFNPKSGKYEVRQLGKQHIGSIVELVAPPANDDSQKFVLVTSLLQVTEEELSGTNYQNWQNGRVKIIKAGRAAARIQITGVFTSDDRANAFPVMANNTDRQLIANLHNGWYSQETITEEPSEESLNDDLKKLIDFPYTAECTLIWEGTITADEKTALLALPGDTEFKSAVVRLTVAAEKAKSGEVIRESISRDLEPLPKTPGNMGMHIRLEKSEDGSRYTALVWIGGLLTDSIKSALEHSLTIWTQATGMQKEVDALIEALDSRVITQTLPPAALIQTELPTILQNRLTIAKDSLSWGRGTPTNAERGALNALEGNEDFLQAVQNLLAALDSDKTIAIGKDDTFTITPSTLKNRIIVNTDPPTLTWKGPAPTDTQRAALDQLLQLPRSQETIILRQLMNAIDARQQVAMKPIEERLRQEDVQQMFAGQLTIRPTEVEWKGRIHSQEQLEKLEALVGDPPFKDAITAIIKEIKEGEVSVPIDRVTRPHQDDLPEILRDKLMIGCAVIRYHGLMTPAEVQAIHNLFTHKVDQRAALRLYTSGLNKGMRGRQLKIRSRRGSAAPSTMIPFETKPIEVGE